jgi:hypothetical protein
MSGTTNWAVEAPAINHNACFEIENTTSVNTAVDNSEFYGNSLPQIIGNSAALQRVLRLVRVVAPTGATVLIQGGNRNWQGADCGSHSQVQRLIEQPICEGELCRHSFRLA